MQRFLLQQLVGQMKVASSTSIARSWGHALLFNFKNHSVTDGSQQSLAGAPRRKSRATAKSFSRATTRLRFSPSLGIGSVVETFVGVDLTPLERFYFTNRNRAEATNLFGNRRTIMSKKKPADRRSGLLRRKWIGKHSMLSTRKQLGSMWCFGCGTHASVFYRGSARDGQVADRQRRSGVAATALQPGGSLYVRPLSSSGQFAA
jgi:hypothetical protein